MKYWRCLLPIDLHATNQISRPSGLYPQTTKQYFNDLKNDRITLRAPKEQQQISENLILILRNFSLRLHISIIHNMHPLQR